MEGLFEEREPVSPEESAEEIELEDRPARSSWSAAKAVLWLLGTVALGWWLLHPRATDREQLEQLIAKGKQGLESRSAVQIMECLAPDYHDGGGLKKGDVAQIVRRVTRESHRIEVTIDDYQLDLHPPKARGYFDVRILLYEGPRSAVPIHWNLDVAFEKQHLGWHDLWRQGWVVTSIDGHGIDRDFERLF